MIDQPLSVEQSNNNILISLVFRTRA